MRMVSDSCSEPFVLGTAQLGFDYGVVNRAGKPEFESACEIVSAAWQGGVRQFDTAQGYGESEAVLGRIFQELHIEGSVKIHTKWSFEKIDFASQIEVLFQQAVDTLKVCPPL